MLRGCQRESQILTFRFAADPLPETDREKIYAEVLRRLSVAERR